MFCLSYAECNFDTVNTLIIESDNCASQYKCAQHFSTLANISTENNINIICVFGIAGHGKSEVDHVGGLAKVAIRRETAATKTFSNSSDMIDCLIEKFGKSEAPVYYLMRLKLKILKFRGPSQG